MAKILSNFRPLVKLMNDIFFSIIIVTATRRIAFVIFYVCNIYRIKRIGITTKYDVGVERLIYFLNGIGYFVCDLDDNEFGRFRG